MGALSYNLWTLPTHGVFKLWSTLILHHQTYPTTIAVSKIIDLHHASPLDATYDVAGDGQRYTSFPFASLERFLAWEEPLALMLFLSEWESNLSSVVTHIGERAAAMKPEAWSGPNLRDLTAGTGRIVVRDRGGAYRLLLTPDRG